MFHVKHLDKNTMGLFGTIKLIKEEYKKIKKYAKMTYDDMIQLSNDELKDVISTRIFGESRRLDVDECIKYFTAAKKVYYIINYYDMEIQNGGLCQYFVNSSRLTAPYLIECLTIIGANNYKTHLENFISKNNIDLTNLDSFIIEDIEEFEIQNSRFPFDEFDDQYYKMYESEPLDEILISYIRENLKEFV